MLKIQNVFFSYGEKKILNGVNFAVKKGEIIALIGTSGSGKTTLFRLIAGLISPLDGTILIADQSPQSQAILTTYMRQDDLLLPWRTVMENLLLFSELGRGCLNKRTLIDSALRLLEKVGLQGVEKMYPNELSGGMRQRVALVRALLQNRPLMLLDEPFASLDVMTREELYLLLRTLRDQYQKTIVMVTHDFRDALALADRILVLSNGAIVGTYQLLSQECKKPGFEEKLIQQIRSDLASVL